MTGIACALVLAALAVLVAVPAGHGADLDRTAVDFKTPGEIAWVRNVAGTNEQAVLFGIRASRGPTSCGSSGCPAT
jgi:hypothetical protein